MAPKTVGRNVESDERVAVHNLEIVAVKIILPVVGTRPVVDLAHYSVPLDRRESVVEIDTFPPLHRGILIWFGVRREKQGYRYGKSGNTDAETKD